MDHESRSAERASVSGDLDAMARRLRTMVRSGLIPPAGLVAPDVMRRIGHAKPSKVHSILVVIALVRAGWVEGPEITVDIKGLDCGGWNHCGPECCGTCMTCGDNYSLWTDREEQRYLVYPPASYSARKAKSECYRIMEEVDKV